MAGSVIFYQSDILHQMIVLLGPARHHAAAGRELGRGALAGRRQRSAALIAPVNRLIRGTLSPAAFLERQAISIRIIGGSHMSYVENNLLPNEQITYRAKLHWIIYGLPVTVFVIAILVALGGGG